MDPTATHYAVLGLPRSPAPTSAAIRAAYLARSLQWHPDRARPTSSATLFARAALAYRVLRDPARRARYDAALRRVVSDVVHVGEVEDGWVPCRCGGGFDVVDGVAEGGVLVVECDTCSLALRVVGGGEEGAAAEACVGAEKGETIVAGETRRL